MLNASQANRIEAAAAEEGAPIINVHATGALLAALIGAQLTGRFSIPREELNELDALALHVRIARTLKAKEESKSGTQNVSD